MSILFFLSLICRNSPILILLPLGFGSVVLQTHTLFSYWTW